VWTGFPNTARFGRAGPAPRRSLAGRSVPLSKWQEGLLWWNSEEAARRASAAVGDPGSGGTSPNQQHDHAEEHRPKPEIVEDQKIRASVAGEALLVGAVGAAAGQGSEHLVGVDEEDARSSRIAAPLMNP
jgi:hypothetical protein